MTSVPVGNTIGNNGDQTQYGGYLDFLLCGYHGHPLCMDKKNQLDVPFCILYFSSNNCSRLYGAFYFIYFIFKFKPTAYNCAVRQTFCVYLLSYPDSLIQKWCEAVLCTWRRWGSFVHLASVRQFCALGVAVVASHRIASLGDIMAESNASDCSPALLKQ